MKVWSTAGIVPGRRNPKYSGEIFSNATLSTTNSTWTALGLNPIVWGKKSGANRLNYGITIILSV
jgi:hypothetical protein